MAFTGIPGTINTQPENIVPMFGAGGIKRAQSLSGQLTSTAVLAATHNFVFTQVSVTLYRAVNRVRSLVTVTRTSQ